MPLELRRLFNRTIKRRILFNREPESLAISLSKFNKEVSMYLRLQTQSKRICQLQKGSTRQMILWQKSTNRSRISSRKSLIILERTKVPALKNKHWSITNELHHRIESTNRRLSKEHLQESGKGLLLDQSKKKIRCWSCHRINNNSSNQWLGLAEWEEKF